MNKIIVAVFNQETEAAKLLNSLSELHRDGRISVYGTTVFAKDADGKISVKQLDGGSGAATLTGLLFGGLVGALAGPVGLLAGMALGGLGGSLVDLEDAGIDARFADEVAKVLTPGKVVVLADIQEEWTAPLDEAVAAAGGLLYRRKKADIADIQWQRDLAAYNAELDALEADNAFLKQGDVFSDDLLKGYIELKRQEVEKMRLQVHPLEFELYYSC